MVPLARSMLSADGAIGGGASGDGVADDVTGECAAGGSDVDDSSSRLVGVIARALLVSSRVSVTPMVGAVGVWHVSGVGVVGGGGVAGGVTVDGVGDVDSRCCFSVWVRVGGVFGLLCALLAGFHAVPGDDHRRLALSVLGGRYWLRVIWLVGLPRVLLQGLGVGEV